MRRKDIIWISAALLTLTGCSSDEDMKSQADGLVPISLTTAMDGEHQAATRAGTAIQSTQFDASETFYAYFASGARIGDDNSPCSTTYTYTGSPAAGATTPAGQPYFAATATEAVVHAYYPYVTGKQVTNETTSFSVEQDQTDATGYKKSDLMYATETISKTSPAATLTFSHMMSKIIVSATAGTDVSTITDVRIVGGNKTINIVNPTTTDESTTPFFGTTPTYNNALSTTSYISMYTSGSAATAECAALLPPQTITNTDAFLEIVTNRGSAFYKLATTFASGYSYTFTLTINAASIGLTTTINDWDITAAPITGKANILSQLGILPIGDQTCTGTNVEPTVTVRYDGVTLTEGTHYDVHYVNNIAPGTASVVVVGKGSYTSFYGNTTFTINTPDVDGITSNMVGWIITDQGNVYPHKSLADANSETPVALIGYVGTSGSVETGSNYRGLALALQDASSSAQYEDRMDYGHTCGSSSTDFFAHRSFLNGIEVSTRQATATGTCSGHTHEAARYAYNYTVTGFDPTTIGCSHWFLPSGGQWLLFVEGGCGFNSWDVTVSDIPTENRSAGIIVNNLFINAGLEDAVLNDSYRACSEYDSTCGWCINFGTAIKLHGSNKNGRRFVRAFLAF